MKKLRVTMTSSHPPDAGGAGGRRFVVLVPRRFGKSQLGAEAWRLAGTYALAVAGSPVAPGVPYDAALAAAGGLVAVRWRGELRLVTFDERNELQRAADAMLGYHQPLTRE